MSVQAIVCAMAIQEISPAEKLLLLAMANYADEHMECWPSQERLAADTCLSDRHVRRILVMLEARKMVSRRPRRRPDGYRASDVITLHFAGQVSPISPDTVSPDIMSPDKSVDLTGQIIPILPDTMSAPTTLEPSVEPRIEPVGGGARAQAAETDDWPKGDHCRRLVEEVASPRLDPTKSPGLIVTAGRIEAWRREGASWVHDVVPVVTGLCAGQRSLISTWKFFDQAMGRAIADNRRDLELPEAAPGQFRGHGPPGLVAEIAAEKAEARRRTLEMMSPKNG